MTRSGRRPRCTLNVTRINDMAPLACSLGCVQRRQTSVRAAPPGGCAASASACRVPGVEPTVRLVLAERALLEASFEEHRERVADDAPRLHPEVAHDLVAVEVGPDAIELLLRA